MARSSRVVPTDLRVGQTQAITVARTEPPSTTRPAPGQAALPRIQPTFDNFCGINGSSSFKGRGSYTGISNLNPPLSDPVPGGRCNAKGSIPLILGSGSKLQRAYLRVESIALHQGHKGIGSHQLDPSHQIGKGGNHVEKRRRTKRTGLEIQIHQKKGGHPNAGLQPESGGSAGFRA